MTDLDPSYVDIALDDRDPQDVFDAMVTAAEARIPDFALTNGSVEAVVFEALALAVTDTVYAINRMPAVVLEALLSLYGVARFPGAPARGTVLLTLDGERQLIVTEGQQFAIPDTEIILTVLEDVDSLGAASLSVPVAATEPSAASNGYGGTFVDVLDDIPFVVSAFIPEGQALTGGLDPESDTAYLTRAAAVLRRVTSSLVVPDHFTAYALENALIKRATTLDLWDPDSGNDIGEDPGHVTVAVYGHGTTVDPEVRDQVAVEMQDRASAMVAVHVIGAEISNVEVEVEVAALPGYDHSDLRAAIIDALRAKIDPSTSEWGATIRPLDIATIVSNVAGVDYVEEVVAPAENVLLAPHHLPVLATADVTVLT